MKKLIAILGIILFTSITHSQSIYPNNEDGQFEDMLTPQYYLSSNSDLFRYEVNKFVYFARKVPFQHPLEDSTGQKPKISIPAIGKFGAGKGPTGTSQHHAAIDLHVENNDTKVTMYAAHDGLVAIYRDAPKYRHYLSITKNVEDNAGNIIGKIVTLYAHIDLDLDSAANILLDGKYVNQGNIVSEHLYSGTVGGPHLHFEIRYYRTGDIGEEEFYGFVGPTGSITLSEPSAGSWPYGYWNPNIGYGFANPENHLQSFATGIMGQNGEIPWEHELFQNYPNPFNPTTTISYKLTRENDVVLTIFDISGREIQKIINKNQNAGDYSVPFNASGLSSGFYLYQLEIGKFKQSKKMLLLR
jgi:murein DD-endopeptidase MepM/ murein hydrolase activator NlpD